MTLAKFVRNHLGIAYIMVLSISVSDQIVLAEAMQLAQTFFCSTSFAYGPTGFADP